LAQIIVSPFGLGEKAMEDMVRVISWWEKELFICISLNSSRVQKKRGRKPYVM